MVMPETDELAESLVSKSPLKVVVYTPLVTVPAVPETEPVIWFATVSEPSDAVCAKRFVELAVVEKKAVEVALARMVLPEKVLLSESSVELAAPASEVR